MPLLNKNKLAAAFDTAQAAWNNALKTVQATWREWAGSLTSDTSSESYHWVELLVVIREWIGERVINSAKGEKWVVENKPYEGTYGLEVDDINDDKLGMLKPLTDSLAAAASYHPENLLSEVALLGFSKPCYDGQNFFDTDHPSLAGDGTTYSNLSTDPFGYDALLAADKQRFTMRNAQGNRIPLEPLAVLVGSKYIHQAQSFFEALIKPGTLNDVNALKGKYKPVLCDRFEGDYAEFFCVLFQLPGNSLRAFIYQERSMPALVCTAMNNVSNEQGVPGQDYLQFMEKKVLFGTDFRGRATFTLPVLAYGSTGTGA